LPQVPDKGPQAGGVIPTPERAAARLGTVMATKDPQRATEPGLRSKLAMSCSCAAAYDIHGHEHAGAWSGKSPIADLKSFWGLLGCSCFAF
jgi:hypothetical protein